MTLQSRLFIHDHFSFCDQGRPGAQLRGKGAQDQRLLHGHPLQSRPHRLPHERHPLGAHLPRRVGERGAAKRQHKVQRHPAHLGARRRRDALLQRARQTQQLLAGGHWRARVHLRALRARPQDAAVQVRRELELQRELWWRRTRLECQPRSVYGPRRALLHEHRQVCGQRGEKRGRLFGGD